jgi:ankyrin repeat protein
MSIGTNSIWQQTVVALDRGDFTLLDELLRSENASLIELLEANGAPTDEMNEAFAFACMVGRTDDAEALLDRGVDPYAGMKTWLAGPHWAASGGQLETLRMMIRHNVPLEVENRYGGTVLGQALWSAIHEPKPDHADIIEALIDAGAKIEPGTLEWWEQQDVPSEELRSRVAEALKKGGAD